VSRATIITIVFVIIVGIGAVLVSRQFRQALDRPAVQREDSQRRLRLMADALRAYRDAHGEFPENLFALFKDQHLQLGANGGYLYRKPPADAPDDYVIMWAERLHEGVGKGQPWGGEGQVATEDIPAVGYVLTRNLAIEALSVDEHRRRAPPPRP
jgi:type II secretory pathway pseudopilin PulG